MLPLNQIHELNLYDYNPDELAATRQPALGTKKWYFFTPRYRRCQNGKRPNRAAGDGFWKASAGDKAVTYQDHILGFKRTLVFYKGKPPGDKTNWIMQEFTLPDVTRNETNDMRLDDCVLCKLYKKEERDCYVMDMPAERVSGYFAPALMSSPPAQVYPAENNLMSRPTDQVHPTDGNEMSGPSDQVDNLMSCRPDQVHPTDSNLMSGPPDQVHPTDSNLMSGPPDQVHPIDSNLMSGPPDQVNPIESNLMSGPPDQVHPTENNLMSTPSDQVRNLMSAPPDQVHPTESNLISSAPAQVHPTQSNLMSGPPDQVHPTDSNLMSSAPPDTVSSPDINFFMSFCIPELMGEDTLNPDSALHRDFSDRSMPSFSNMDDLSSSMASFSDMDDASNSMASFSDMHRASFSDMDDISDMRRASFSDMDDVNETFFSR
ncbi:NAC domain-containing protein 74-like [Cornus florida]|uniref:NAC domain-containing protein 74-like n=1 Tax=Cornus florida TaxID=4283 RepID=UPI00289820F4|nr:NAC domain-containing protein 74-like [Cornus florida]